MNKVAIFLLLLLPLHPSSAVLINIDANKSLQYYLCDGQVELEDQTTLTLSSQLEHVLKPSLACIIHSLQNITIRGEGGSTSTIIKCENDDILHSGPTTGFGFYNITGLSLIDLHLVGCGGFLEPQLREYLSKNIEPFLIVPAQQTAVITLIACTDVKLDSIRIDGGYYGYGIMGVNLKETSTFSNTIIKHSRNCSYQYCMGSGLIIVFNDQDSPLSIMLHNINIRENTNHQIFDINPIDMLYHAYNSVPMFGAGGLTVLGMKYEDVSIKMENVMINRNKGSIVGGALFLITTGEGAMDIIINKSSFTKNELTEERRGGGIGIFITRPQASETNQHIWEYPTNNNFSITFASTAISMNYGARFGGGVFVQFPNFLFGNASIRFTGCIIILNMVSREGHALYVTSDNTDIEKSIVYKVSIIIEDSMISRNGEGVFPFHLHPGGHFHKEDQWLLMVGSVLKFVRVSSVIMRGRGEDKKEEWGGGTLLLEQNTGSAIAATHTNITMTGYIRIG